LARRTLAGHFKIQTASLRDVSATPSKLPERTDWTITFADADASRSLPQGEARLSARISGNEITDTRQFVYVPEDWERTDRNARTVASIVQVATGVLGGVMVFGGVIAAIMSWSRGRFVVRLSLAVFAVFLVLTSVRLANNFPTVMANLMTSQPLRLQLAILVGTSVVGLGLFSAALALVAGAAPLWSAAAARLESRQAIAVAVALGALAAAARMLGALGAAIGAHEPAPWPSYAGAGSFVPFLSAATNPIVAMLTRLIVLLLIVAAVDRITAGWTRRRVLAAALLWIVGGLLGATGSPENLLPWIASAAVVGALLVAVYIPRSAPRCQRRAVCSGGDDNDGDAAEGWSQAYPGRSRARSWLSSWMWGIAYGGARGSAAGLAVQPVGQLDEEDVVGRRAKDGVRVPAEPESTRHEVVLPSLLPDDEERRARLVFPPQDVRRPERLHVEIRILRVRERRVARRVVAAPAVHQLLERAVVAGRDERLRIELQRQGRRHRVVQAARERDRCLIQIAERVVLAGVGNVFDPLILLLLLRSRRCCRSLRSRLDAGEAGPGPSP
jgi:hypothetical protein